MARASYKEYAIYRGDDFETLGTVEELAKIYNVTVRTIYYLASKQYKRRIKADSKGLAAYAIEKDDEKDGETA